MCCLAAGPLAFQEGKDSSKSARFLAVRLLAVYNRTALTVVHPMSAPKPARMLRAIERAARSPCSREEGNPHETTNSDTGACDCRTPDRVGARSGLRPATVRCGR